MRSDVATAGLKYPPALPKRKEPPKAEVCRFCIEGGEAMSAGSARQRTEAMLREYCRQVGLEGKPGLMRVLEELVGGIVWSGSVQLTNAARRLADTSAHLKKAVKRLSEHLANPRVNHLPWQRALRAYQGGFVGDLDPIAVDATELAKPYARHMEFQCTVRDASGRAKAGGHDEPLVPGYWVLGAYHWQERGRILSPLMLMPYSQELPGFLSENDCWQRGFSNLREATGGRGVWVLDRGNDRPEIFKSLLIVQKRWIVRLREDRPLIGPDGSIRPAGTWADEALLTRPERGRAVTLPVKLPLDKERSSEKLHLVITTYRFGAKRERLVLLTRGLIGQRVGPRQVRRMYARRWRAEDAKRFFGQLWHVEKFLTRSYVALERMLGCVTCAGGFLAELQRENPGLAREIEKEGVLYTHNKEKVPCYRLARGIMALALRHDPSSVLQNA